MTETNVLDRPGQDALWEWFGLSYATFLTLPRVLMHEMPDEWQGEMARLLREADAAFPGVELHTTVRATNRDGRLVPMPRWLLNYRHPDRAEIDRARQGAM